MKSVLALLAIALLLSVGPPTVVSFDYCDTLTSDGSGTDQTGFALLTRHIGEEVTACCRTSTVGNDAVPQSIMARNSQRPLYGGDRPVA